MSHPLTGGRMPDGLLPRPAAEAVRPAVGLATVLVEVGVSPVGIGATGPLAFPV